MNRVDKAWPWETLEPLATDSQPTLEQRVALLEQMARTFLLTVMGLSVGVIVIVSAFMFAR